MDRPAIWRHPSSREHDTGAHPERIERIVAIERALEAADWLGYAVRDSPGASDAAIGAVHPAGHVARLEALCAAGGGAIDMDTVVSEGSMRAARHAAGGGVAMVDELLGAGARAGASLHRPPGHHATAGRAMGFCLLNHVAVAARHALDYWDAGRVLILDWDVHHGNGTNDIFSGDPRVLFVSIHESPLYPGTGPETDTGTGAGEGYTVNLPVPGGSGDAAFCSLVEHVAVPLARSFAPSLILVSAGFDAHAYDPLASCRVSTGGYAAMASSVRRVAGELGIPVGLVLEGGYDLDALTEGLTASLTALAGGPGPVPELPVHPLARRANERIALPAG